MTLRSIRTGLLTIMSGDSQLHQSQALVIIYHLFCLLSPSSHALATSLPRASLFSTCLLFKIHLSLNSFQYTFFFLRLCSSDATHLLLLLSSHLFLTSWCLLCCRPSPALLRPPTHTHPIPTYSSLPQVISITVSFPEAVSLSLLSLLYNVSPSCVASSSLSASSTHIGFCRRRVYIYTIKAYIFRILG